MFERAMKEFDVWDIGLIKVAVALVVFGLIGVFPQLSTWAQSINPLYFFLAALVVAAKPIYRFFIEGWKNQKSLLHG